MTLAYIRWRDACSEEASDPTPRPVVPQLCELEEVGFLLAETDEVITIGMEHGKDDMKPGRWRLHIPKVCIVEMRTAAVETAFKRKRKV